jgi:hypothetical protein
LVGEWRASKNEDRERGNLERYAKWRPI